MRVLFFIDFVRARRSATFDMKIQTLTLAFLRNLRMAQPDAESKLQRIENVFTAYPAHKRTEISVSVLFDFSGNAEIRKFLFDICLNVRISFVIF